MLEALRKINMKTAVFMGIVFLLFDNLNPCSYY